MIRGYGEGRKQDYRFQRIIKKPWLEPQGFIKARPYF